MSDQGNGGLLAELCAAVEPISEVDALRARERIRRAGPQPLGRLGSLAEQLAGVRRTLGQPLSARAILVCAGDHGFATACGQTATAAAMRELASGRSAVAAAARSADASLVLVDCGIAGAASADLGRGVLAFRLGDATASFRDGPAMAIEVAEAGLRTGVALAFSLADGGLDLLALGGLGAGSEASAAAVIAVLAPATATDLDDDVRETAAAGLAANRFGDDPPPLHALAALGGFETAVLAGAVLAAASIRVPIVLDGLTTTAAALVATRACDRVRGYLIAAHGGGRRAHRVALSALGLEPLLDLGIARGEGAGAALAIPLIVAAARVLCEMG